MRPSSLHPQPSAASPLPRWGWLTLLVTALLGSVASLAAWRYSVGQERGADQMRFEQRVQDAVAELQSRVDEGSRLLRAATALFAASDTVSRADWLAFANVLKLEDGVPGLLGVGQAVLVTPEQLATHVAQQRADGMPHYSVRPEGQRPLYAPVVMREPHLGQSARAVGFDLYTEPSRRAAMERARDTAQPALTGSLMLLTERSPDQQVLGTLLFAPLYRQRAPSATVAERRAALTGWVYAPFDLQLLLDSVVKHRADDMLLTMWDGTGRAEPVYEAHREQAAAMAGFQPSHETRRVIDVAGQQWTLRFATLPDFDATLPAHRANAVLAGGLLLTAMMVLLAALLLALRGRAVALAQTLSAAYRASEARLRTVHDHAAEGIVTLDGSGCLLSANRAAQALLGLDERSLADKPSLPGLLALDFAALCRELAPGDAAPHTPRQWRATVDHTRADGSSRVLQLSASQAPLGDGSNCIVLLVADISELERAQSLASEAHRLNKAILASAPLALVALDAEGRIRTVNPATEHLLGYANAELAGRRGAELALEEDVQAQALRLSAEVGEPISPNAVMRERALRNRAEPVECALVRKDGSLVPVMMTVVPLRDDQQRVDGFLAIAHDISERKRSEAYIQHMAHHDELTGLPNRTLLHDRARLAIEAMQPGTGRMAVLLLDLDRFRQINDSLGHLTGDAVLCTVAARVRHLLRSSDTVARMGADEFVVLLPNIESTAQAERVAEKLLAAVAEPIQTGKQRLTITGSIGIACFPEDGMDLATLLRNADVATNHSKTVNCNAVTLYDAQMHTTTSMRLELEGELRQALALQQLSVHYQPLVSLADGATVGVEALLRWQHPQRGNIPPMDFIPIAEETGLIVPIGEWVLRTACADMQRLQQSIGRRLKVAVNLSPRQLAATDIAAVTATALSSAGWRAEDLELEITESMVVANPDESIAAMQRLRAMGVRIAIDDFGTGYSSLSYLTRFPLAKLKLDRSFVRGLPDNERDGAIATSVVAMGHGLKLDVLAEGIETEAQWHFLRDLGCDMGQGYHFAKPMPYDALVKHLQSHAEAPIPA
jgi:diguanylate cyclase (GGDEF)-like protein/PAS domain S-box-containing protein